jgi:hypothetical protein
VDGNGLKRVEDRSLALALLEKVNNFNDYIFFSALIPVLIFAALPLSTVSSMGAVGAVFGGLYFLNGNIPYNV